MNVFQNVILKSLDTKLIDLQGLWNLSLFNESLFLAHALVIVTIVMFALKLGKEALITTFCILALLANLLALKQIEFFSWSITCSDAYEIGSFLALAFINKYFGEKLAKKAIWVCFIILLLFSLSSILHLFYKPSQFDSMHKSYADILGHTPRIFASSIFAYFFSQKICLNLQKTFTKFKKLPNALCISFSIGISQLLDNFMFTYLAFFGILHNLMHIIFMSYAIKLLCLFIMTPFIKFSSKFIKEPAKAT